MSVSDRYKQWMRIKDSMDPKTFGHDCIHLPSLEHFKQHFDISQNNNPADTYVRSLSLNMCGCDLCLDYAKLHMFETQMELIAKVGECQKLSEHILQLSKTKTPPSRVRKKAESVTVTCEICQKPAKSNNAKLCRDKKCYNARKAQVRTQHIRDKKPINTLCIICGKAAKDNKAKLCHDKACYNTHKNNARKAKQANTDSILLEQKP